MQTRHVKSLGLPFKVDICKESKAVYPRWDFVFSRGEVKCLAKPKSQILSTGGSLPSSKVLSSFRSLHSHNMSQ